MSEGSNSVLGPNNIEIDDNAFYGIINQKYTKSRSSNDNIKDKEILSLRTVRKRSGFFDIVIQKDKSSYTHICPGYEINFYNYNNNNYKTEKIKYTLVIPLNYPI